MTGLPARVRENEDGFTLVELVVATAILGIILLAVGGLMFSTTTTQRSVSAVNDASSSAQTAADGLRTQLRNAAGFRLTTVDGHDQLLVARVASTGTPTTYTCRAWYFARDERELRTTTWPAPRSTALPTRPDQVSTWALLLRDVSPRPASTAVFGSPTLPSAPVEVVGGTLEIAFEVASDDRNKPTAIKFTATSGGAQGGVSTC